MLKNSDLENRNSFSSSSSSTSLNFLRSESSNRTHKGHRRYFLQIRPDNFGQFKLDLSSAVAFSETLSTILRLWHCFGSNGSLSWELPQFRRPYPEVCSFLFFPTWVLSDSSKFPKLIELQASVNQSLIFFIRHGFGLLHPKLIELQASVKLGSFRFCGF